jgi:hypothetical protein
VTRDRVQIGDPIYLPFRHRTCIMGGGVQLGPLGTAATNRPIVPARDDYDDGEIGGMIGRGNQSIQRKSAPVPLCPPQTPHAAWTRIRAAAAGSQWLTTSATARPATRLVSTSNYRTTSNLHNSQITTAPTRLFPACYIFTSSSLAMASNSGDSSASHAQVLSAEIHIQNFLTTDCPLLITSGHGPCSFQQ